MGLQRPTAGEVLLRGQAARLLDPGLRAFRRQVQMVLQDAAGSLNPRQTVYESVAEGIRLHRRVAADAERTHRGRAGRGRARRGRAASAGAAVPALPARAVRRPEAARADRRRAGAAARAAHRRRAGLLAWTPRSAARSSRCCCKLREDLGLGVVVVTHDLGLAWNIADRIAVMYLGRVVECGTTEEVLELAAAPLHAGAAVRRARDRAARAGRAHRRDPRPDAASPAAAGSTRAARPLADGDGGARPGSADALPDRRRSAVLPGDR